MSRFTLRRLLEAMMALAWAVLAWTAAIAEPLAYQMPVSAAAPVFDPSVQDADALNPADQLPSHLRRRAVHYAGSEAPGTIVIDTSKTYLYYVLGGGTAIRYGIGVGREGFAWSGIKFIDHKSEWPDWTPPPEMVERQPYLPRFMAGGPGNPLGARAIYLGGTLYRIHGTNAPSSIGHRVSSGCIRMLNDDVIDLYARVNVGTQVVVLPIVPASPAPARRYRDPARAAAAGARAIQAFGVY